MILKILIFSLMTSCSFIKLKPNQTDSDVTIKEKISNLQQILDQAEENATVDGKMILTTSRTLIAEQKIVVGSCWDYINMVYNQARYPVGKRIIALKSKTSGPYADQNLIESGDWLYFINHSFSRREHSGIFVEWMNFEKKKALVMSYIGGKSKTPATYKIYDLKNVYYIIRPKHD